MFTIKICRTSTNIIKLLLGRSKLDVIFIRINFFANGKINFYLSSLFFRIEFTLSLREVPLSNSIYELIDSTKRCAGY